jgi:hypothetical protein
VSLAAYVRQCYHGLPSETEKLKRTHDKEDTDSSKDDLGRGKYLEVRLSLGHRQIRMRQHAWTHRTNALAEGGGQRADDIHGWLKPLDESLIAALRLIELVGFLLKYGEYSLRRITGFYLLCEWVGGKILSGLLVVLFEGLIEDWLKIWSGRRYLDVGGHLSLFELISIMNHRIWLKNV